MQRRRSEHPALQRRGSAGRNPGGARSRTIPIRIRRRHVNFRAQRSPGWSTDAYSHHPRDRPLHPSHVGLMSSRRWEDVSSALELRWRFFTANACWPMPRTRLSWASRSPISTAWHVRGADLSPTVLVRLDVWRSRRRLEPACIEDARGFGTRPTKPRRLRPRATSSGAGHRRTFALRQGFGRWALSTEFRQTLSSVQHPRENEAFRSLGGSPAHEGHYA